MSGTKFVSVGLERHQRLFLDIDDEPMPLDEATIADCLRKIAEDSSLEHSMYLEAVATALEGRDEHHILQLKQRKRGRFVPPHQTMHRLREVHNVEIAVSRYESLGLQNKAAVSKVAETYGKSRAWVFKALKECREFQEALEHMRQFGLEYRSKLNEKRLD